jgi:hypothetical protein
MYLSRPQSLNTMGRHPFLLYLYRHYPYLCSDRDRVTVGLLHIKETFNHFKGLRRFGIGIDRKKIGNVNNYERRTKRP